MRGERLPPNHERSETRSRLAACIIRTREVLPLGDHPIGHMTKEKTMPERIDADDGRPVKNLDLWAFTSSRAKREFERDGKIDAVKKDIVEEVLEGGDWTDQDRRFLAEADELVQQGVLEEKGSYWYCSPYPPTYRALKSGEILGRRFDAGQDLVYQPAKNVDSDQKLIVGKFQTTTQTESHAAHKTMAGRM